MLVDHIGKLLFPQLWPLQLVGRLAFPFFAYCTSFGVRHTSDFKRYLGRLLLCGAVSQPVFAFVFGGARLNVLFTLALGALLLSAYQRRSWWGIALLLLAAFLLPVEYGLPGVLLVLAFGALADRPPLALCAAVMVLLLGYAPGMQSFAVIALPLICFPVGFETRPPKAFFYCFYPSHLVLLGAVRVLW